MTINTFNKKKDQEEFECCNQSYTQSIKEYIENLNYPCIC